MMFSRSTKSNFRFALFCDFLCYIEPALVGGVNARQSSAAPLLIDVVRTRPPVLTHKPEIKVLQLSILVGGQAWYRPYGRPVRVAESNGFTVEKARSVEQLQSEPSRTDWKGGHQTVTG
jgi:hypothetical protein